MATGEATIVYGPGGVGKGTVATYLASEIVRDPDQVVLVADYEGHEQEWGYRFRGLGLSADERARLHYVAPFSRQWEAKRGSLLDVAELLRDEAARLGATVLIVDSYSTATSTGDSMGGQAAAQEYYRALSIIGLPSLTIAHVAGNAERWPAKPFGSVFVHYLARETWAVERVGGTDQDTWDPALREVYTIVLELRCQKANGRARPAPVNVRIEHYPDGTLLVTRESARASIPDRIRDVLTKTPSMTLKAIVAAIREDTGETIKESVVSDALRRRRDFVADESKGRPFRWSLREG